MKEKMVFEFMLLAALIIVFIVSFCGLLQKIRQTYEREREIAERENRVPEAIVNPTFLFDGVYEIVDPRTGLDASSGGVFPNAPPAYSEIYVEPPPKYDEVIKEPISIEIYRPENVPIHTITISNSTPTTIPERAM